ncbi:MAG: GIY-YIG nuclease family protein [Candidatus Peribacteria bacterium]|nr:GIY-YIG nuclease family protein [Candidatus Peribacteria bacterium]
MEQRCVYILKGDRYYIGSTCDLGRRLSDHKRGNTKTTKRIGNRELITSICCATKEEARALESKIKCSAHPERWCKVEQPRC